MSWTDDTVNDVITWPNGSIRGRYEATSSSTDFKLRCDICLDLVSCTLEVLGQWYCEPCVRDKGLDALLDSPRHHPH